MPASLEVVFLPWLAVGREEVAAVESLCHPEVRQLFVMLLVTQRRDWLFPPQEELWVCLRNMKRPQSLWLCLRSVAAVIGVWLFSCGRRWRRQRGGVVAAATVCLFCRCLSHRFNLWLLECLRNKTGRKASTQIYVHSIYDIIIIF